MPQQIDFPEAFSALTDHGPFPWQERLYDKFLAGKIPPACDIPTGLGKTSVIAIWLIALAAEAETGRMPRRLVYVVNRRTVVDQTTVEVERLRMNLAKLNAPFKTIAISTLRGQYADNHEWSADPSKPAVICGTVDMIGSRLLFGGYRIGFKSHPLHAGFLGQDVLLVHDEAHLEPAFQRLIEKIQEEQQREVEQANGLPWLKLQVMALSATTRNEENKTPFGLTEQERNPPEVIPYPPTQPIHHVWKRLKATKILQLHPCDDEKKSVAQIVNKAWESKESNAAVLVFARKVEEVKKIAGDLIKRLKKEKLPENVAILTGAMRGFERDELVRSNDVFARFMPSSDSSANIKGSAYLVCTSAGEVGVNLSADHMVCDLSTFDSMVQRFGRVNRFGKRDNTEIHVVYPESFDGKGTNAELEARRQKTLELLRKLSDNASPLALSKLNERDGDACRDAFAPQPTILPATDILFDAWAMTTIREKMPGRPPVEPYLHGVAEWEPPRTSVAWREEVGVITDKLLERHGRDFPREILDDYPFKPHELLSDISDRVFKQLSALVKDPKFTAKSKPNEHRRAMERASQNRNAPVWLVQADGIVRVTTLMDVVGDGKGQLNNLTVLLPPSVGGLEGGMLNDSKPYNNVTYDVADEWYEDKTKTVRRRIRCWDDEEPPKEMGKVALIRTIDTKPDVGEFGEPSDEEDSQASHVGRRVWKWYTKPLDAGNVTLASTTPIRLEHHANDVVERATAIVDKLGLPEDMKRAVCLAAKLHDLGKKRRLWQRSIGNPVPNSWYAKSGKPANGPRWRPRRLNDYRHEFGSLLDILHCDPSHLADFHQLDETMQDVVLHLIAAHHGYARPHFPTTTTIDPDHTQVAADKAAIDIPRRYARLQRKYGRWGLAYLESLLRAADWAASAEPSETGKNTQQEDPS
jgi:CRISPR-associated endonuclease/helicase Cas3